MPQSVRKFNLTLAKDTQISMLLTSDYAKECPDMVLRYEGANAKVLSEKMLPVLGAAFAKHAHALNPHFTVEAEQTASSDALPDQQFAEQSFKLRSTSLPGTPLNSAQLLDTALSVLGELSAHAQVTGNVLGAVDKYKQAHVPNNVDGTTRKPLTMDVTVAQLAAMATANRSPA